MNTVGTPLLWGGFAVVVAIMLAIDLLLQGRRGSHSMTMKQAAGWSILWVTLSLLFNAAFWWYLVQTQGRAVADPQALAFLTGYLIEKALAVDNVFVWVDAVQLFRRTACSAAPGVGVWRTGRDRSAYHYDLRRQLADFAVRLAAVRLWRLPAVYRREDGAGERGRLRHRR